MGLIQVKWKLVHGIILPLSLLKIFFSNLLLHFPSAINSLTHHGKFELIFQTILAYLLTIKVYDVVGGGCAGVRQLDCKPGAPGSYLLAIMKGAGIPMKAYEPGMNDKIIDFCRG